MSETPTRYPLAWPIGWRRTAVNQRARAGFRKSGKTPVLVGQSVVVRNIDRPLTVWQAIQRLTRELGLLGAADEVLSTNVAVRLDGMPRSDKAEPGDPGAAVYFTLRGKPLCLACDKWTRVADNIASIAQHIDALRRIERYGIGTIDQAFAGYAQLEAAPFEWWIVLELRASATLVEVEEAFRRLAKTAHPDLPGGSHDRMARLTAAREAARQELGHAAR